MFLLVLALGLFSLFFGEKVQAGNGLGWDGRTYAKLTRDLIGIIGRGELNSYYAQRVLPPGIVSGLLSLTGASPTDANIIRYFEWYNLALILVSCYVWKRIADHFTLGAAGRWIGFAGLFVTFQASKSAYFLPVQTDVTASLVGLLLVLFYVEKKPFALLATAIVGAFSWPIVSISGAILLALPARGGTLPPISDGAGAPLIRPEWLKRLFYLVTGLSVAAYLALRFLPAADAAFLYVLGAVADILPGGVGARAQRVIEAGRMSGLFRQLFTAVPSIAGLGLAMLALIGANFGKIVVAEIRGLRVPNIGLALLAVLVPFLIVRQISNPEVPNPSSLALLIRLSLLPAEGKFFMPLVSLAVFWGPILLLLLLNWRTFWTRVAQLGPGAAVLIAVTLPFGLVGEPRFLATVWPFMVLALVLVYADAPPRRALVVGFAALTVVTAQFWLWINVERWVGDDPAALLEWPKQLLFMHYGLWMGWPAYLAQSVLLIAGTAWLYIAGKERGSA